MVLLVYSTIYFTQNWTYLFLSLLKNRSDLVQSRLGNQDGGCYRRHSSFWSAGECLEGQKRRALEFPILMNMINFHSRIIYHSYILYNTDVKFPFVFSFYGEGKQKSTPSNIEVSLISMTQYICKLKYMGSVAQCVQRISLSPNILSVLIPVLYTSNH